MMKHCIFTLLSLLIPLTCTGITAAEDGRPIISYQSQPQKIVESDFVKRLLALPEWEPFCREFTAACDKGLKKELGNRDKMERSLPKEVVDHIGSGLDNLSSRKGIDEFFRHVETILFSLRADDDHEKIDENLIDLSKLLNGRDKDVELDFDGYLAFVVDLSPRPWLSLLKGFREGRDYKFLRNDTDGDFILDFEFEVRNREISFCCAGVKLPGDKPRYALIFSNDDEIQKVCDTFKSGAPLKEISPQPLEQLVLKESCFLFLEQQRKKDDWKIDTSEVFNKIVSLTISFRDVEGVSRIDAKAETRNADDAKALHDIFVGLIALVQFSQGSKDKEEAKQVVQFLQSIKLDFSGNETTVAIKLDQPDLWKLIGKGLVKATEEIAEKNK